MHPFHLSAVPWYPPRRVTPDAPRDDADVAPQNPRTRRRPRWLGF